MSAASDRGVHLATVAAGASLAWGAVALGRAVRAYAPDRGESLAGLAVIAAGVALAGAERRGPRLATEVAPLHLAAGAGVAAAPLVALLAHPTPGLALGCLAVGVAFSAATLTVAAVALARSLLPIALELGLVPALCRPLPLLVAGGLGLCLAGLVDRLGVHREAVLAGAALALSGSAADRATRRAFGEAPGGGGASHAALVGAVAAAALLGWLERRLPLAVVTGAPDEVLYASRAPAGRALVVVAAPGGQEIYADGQLAVGSVDRERAADALTAPALATLRAGGSVLVLHGGTPAVERRLLARAEVAAVTVVSLEPELRSLARVPGAAPPRDDPRVRRITAEPAPWLAASAERFDAILGEGPLPLDPIAAKEHTASFHQLVAAHLLPGGLAVLPAGSALEAPRAVASLEAAARTTGLPVRRLDVALPTRGVASYLLLGAPAESALRARVEGRDIGLDLRALPPSAPSRLHDPIAFAGLVGGAP